MTNTGKDKRIQLASLDLFWMPRIAEALEPIAKPELISTWSLKRPQKWDFPATNVWPLHYGLQVYKMVPAVQYDNWTYLMLCRAFDQTLNFLTQRNVEFFWPLSGFALHTLRRFKRAGIPICVECGSTHPDYQDEIIRKEFSKNQQAGSLFPEAYRTRVNAEFEEANWIHVPSTFVKNTFIEAGTPEKKILVAPFGADVNRFRPANSLAENRPFRVICSSGVNLRKGARILVEAWRKLAWKDAELHWIGTPGKLTKHLFQPLPSGIVWHRWMEHTRLSELYRACDVLALPSFEEGFARVLVEAAASGLALIATPNTGVADFFTDGNPEGWLIETDSVDSLCSALEEARDNREGTRVKGLLAAERADQAFTWEHYGDRIRQNFGKMVASDS